MVWGPLCEECQDFHGICVQDKVVTPSGLMHRPAHPFYNLQVESLQSLEWREVGLK